VRSRTCGLVERGAHAGVGLLAGLLTLWKGPTLEQFVKNCSPWEGPVLEKFVENCLPWVGPHAGAGEEREEEGVAETTCDKLTATPVPYGDQPGSTHHKEPEGWLH